MSLSLDDFRCKLMDKIILAGSQQDVKRFCDGAMKGLEHHQVNGHIVVRFVDKMISDLDQFSPIGQDAQQWSNIQMAKIQFNRIKMRLTAETL